MTVGGGDAFPQRDLILFLTFCAILATLVLQGLTLGPLITALRLKSEDEADKVEELETRLEGARAAIERLEQLSGERISLERPGANARAIRGAYPTLRVCNRRRRHHRGVRPELRGLARLAARADQGRAGGGTLHAEPRRGQPGGDTSRDARPRPGGIAPRRLKSTATGDEANS